MQILTANKYIVKKEDRDFMFLCVSTVSFLIPFKFTFYGRILFKDLNTNTSGPEPASSGSKKQEWGGEVGSCFWEVRGSLV